MSAGGAKLRVALIQMRMGEDPAANLARALDFTRQAITAGAKLVCLPELFRSRYFCQSEDPARFALAETVPGATTEEFAKLAAKHGVTVVLSLFERRAAGLYHNTAAIVDGDKGVVGSYRKMHIPDDPRYYEKFYFAPGDLGFRSFADRGRQSRRARVLGPVVPGGRAAHRAPGRRPPHLSDRDRLASRGESRGGRAPARRVGDHAALARDRQRLLRPRHQPHRLRAGAGLAWRERE